MSEYYAVYACIESTHEEMYVSVCAIMRQYIYSCEKMQDTVCVIC